MINSHKFTLIKNLGWRLFGDGGYPRLTLEGTRGSDYVYLILKSGPFSSETIGSYTINQFENAMLELQKLLDQAKIEAAKECNV